jgi:translocation and assembly module TamB
LAHSPLVIEKVAEHFAPDYNITYSRIYGNALTGLEIDDLAYRGKTLAGHIVLRWKPNALIDKELAIKKIVLDKVNVDNIKSFTQVFLKLDANTSKTNTKEAPLPMVISVEHLSINVEAFVEKNISVKSTEFSLETLRFAEDTLTISEIDLTLKVEKNFDNISMHGLSLKIEDIFFDRQKMQVKEGKVLLALFNNISTASYRGNIHKNTLNGHLQIQLKELFYSLYPLPIRDHAIPALSVEINASKTQILARLETKITEILKAEQNLSIDIRSLETYLRYSIATGVVKVSSKAFVDSPYAKDIAIVTHLGFDEVLGYKGNIVLKGFEGIDSNFRTLLDHLHIDYEGNTTAINMQIESDGLRGSIISKDFKKASVDLETKNPLMLKEFLTLPKGLKEAKASLRIYAPLSFEDNASLEAEIVLDSNIVSMKAKLKYKDTLIIKSTLKIPKGSLLKSYNKNVKWKALNPIDIDASITETEAKGILTSGALRLNANYKLRDSSLFADIDLGDLHTSIEGKVEEELSIDTNIPSVSKALKSISKIYTLKDFPKIKGDIKSKIRIKKMKELEITLSSKALDTLKNIHIKLGISLLKKKIEVLLHNYTLEYERYKLFAKKPSTMTLKGDDLSINSLWLNDEIAVKGKYNLKNLGGKIDISSHNFTLFLKKLIHLAMKLGIKTSINGKNTDISGKVTLMGGNILYDLATKTFASDSDIVLHKKYKKKKSPNTFMDNLSLNLQIETQKPLRFKKNNIHVKSDIRLSIQKSKKSEIMLVGSVELLKGGTYRFENKTFILNKSFIYFTGDMSKPLVDISVGYQAINHKITINISGMPSSPHISFSSVPRLSKETILSIILFDSEAGAETNSAEDMMKMMGGVMAKSVLSNFGIQVDSLVFGKGNSIEVGKKLTNKLTIIYVNDTVSEVKLNYEHGKHTKSVISVSEESQSYDIVYKRDF